LKFSNVSLIHCNNTHTATTLTLQRRIARVHNSFVGLNCPQFLQCVTVYGTEKFSDVGSMHCNDTHTAATFKLQQHLHCSNTYTATTYCTSPQLLPWVAVSTPSSATHCVAVYRHNVLQCPHLLLQHNVLQCINNVAAHQTGKYSEVSSVHCNNTYIATAHTLQQHIVTTHTLLQHIVRVHTSFIVSTHPSATLCVAVSATLCVAVYQTTKFSKVSPIHCNMLQCMLQHVAVYVAEKESWTLQCKLRTQFTATPYTL